MNPFHFITMQAAQDALRDLDVQPPHASAIVGRPKRRGVRMPTLVRIVVTICVIGGSLVIASPKASAIIGGSAKEGDTSPYVHIGVRNYYGETSYASRGCSGTLIGDRWVLSAAHCFTHTEDRINVVAVTVTTASGSQIPYEVAKVTLHPLLSTFRGYDVAILETRETIKDATYLPYGGYAEAKLKRLSTFATGFGMTESNVEGSPPTDVVMSVQTPVDHIDGQLMQANSTGVGSICSGDSGGSLTAIDPAFAQPVLVGVLYATLNVNSFCDIRFSFLSVNVGHVSSWIQEVSSIPPAVTAPMARNIIKDFGKGIVPQKTLQMIYSKQAKTICSSSWVAPRQAKFRASLAKALDSNRVPRHPNYLAPAYYPDALIPVVLGGGFDYKNLAWFSADPYAKSDRDAFIANISEQVCSGKMHINRALFVYRRYLTKQ